MGSGIYLRPLDRLDPHGLLSPSPGGGRVPVAGSGSLCAYPDHRNWREDERRRSDCYMCQDLTLALVLRTSAGEVDPIGMARAREVLARIEPKTRPEDAPEAHVPRIQSGDTPITMLAARLAYLGVCEVIRW